MERLDVLLMRVVDGEASESERHELLELAEAEPRLAELVELRGRLKTAVLGQVSEHLDVVGEVLTALTLVDGWDEAAAELRSELSGGLAEDSMDVADAVMAELMAVELAPLAELAEETEEQPTEDELLEMRLSAMVDGELSGAERMALAARLRPEQINAMTVWANQGRQVREALESATRGQEISLWPEVAEQIGLSDPEHVPGWEPVAAALREAISEHGSLSAREEVAMTAAIMNGLPRTDNVIEFEPQVDPELMDEPEDSFENTGLGKLFSSPGLQWAAALAAAILLGVMAINGPMVDGGDEATTAPGNDRVALVTQPEDTGKQDLDFAEVNEAEVEELESADEVMVQVFQMEEGAPMFLMIDEGDEGATL